MLEILTRTLVCFGSVFAIVDPFAALPVFIALTGERTRNEQRRIALLAATTCFVVLTVFALGGALIMSFFSVSLPAFKIAGGVILFGVGMEMVRARRSATRTTQEEQSDAEHKDDVALIPLGLPLLSGPGAMATVMVLASSAKSIPLRIGVHVAIAAVSVATLLVLRSAGLLARIFGRTGLNVIGRVMGIILVAYAVQFMLDGLKEAFPRALGG